MDENGYIVEPEELDTEPQSSKFLMITYDVLADNRLSDFQKLLFASITGLCRGEKGYCWASNAYFEKFFNKSNTQVSEGISKLVEYGYLKREIVYKRKEDKKGKIITTKQISFRKLFVILNDNNQNTGIPENQNRGIPENQKQIDNPIIDNPTSNNLLLSKDNKNYIEDNTETVVHLADDNNLKNNNIKENESMEEVLEEVGKTVGTDGIEVFGNQDGLVEVPKTAAASPEPKKKGKGGLAPLYDLVDERIPGDKYPTINIGCKTYLKAHIGIRRLPSMEKWNGMLDFLINESSISINGTSGKKIVPSKAIAILEKAINGKDGVPYLDFDKVDGGLMEPTVETNQRNNTGY